MSINSCCRCIKLCLWIHWYLQGGTWIDRCCSNRFWCFHGYLRSMCDCVPALLYYGWIDIEKKSQSLLWNETTWTFLCQLSLQSWAFLKPSRWQSDERKFLLLRSHLASCLILHVWHANSIWNISGLWFLPESILIINFFACKWMNTFFIIFVYFLIIRVTQHSLMFWIFFSNALPALV